MIPLREWSPSIRKCEKSRRHSNACKTGGCFEAVVNHPWNRRRSGLNHTDYGNPIFRIWNDTERWESLLLAQAGDDEALSPASRAVWERAFALWPQVKLLMQAHAIAAPREFQPWRDIPLLPGMPQNTYDLMAARTHERWRLSEWVQAVLQALEQVDAAVRDLESSLTRERLVSLAERGRSLRDLFSGSGYFFTVSESRSCPPP